MLVVRFLYSSLWPRTCPTGQAHLVHPAASHLYSFSMPSTGIQTNGPSTFDHSHYSVPHYHLLAKVLTLRARVYTKDLGAQNAQGSLGRLGAAHE